MLSGRLVIRDFGVMPGIVPPSSSRHDWPRVVRIGCCPIPLQRLQSFLGALQVQAPCVETEVLHLDTAEQVARLRAGDLDLGVIDYAEPAPPLRMQPLYAGERVAVVLSPGHPLAARPAIRPGDLAGETLLSPSRTANPAFHDVLDRALSGAGHRVRGWRETRGSDPHDVLFGVAQGQGVALGPSSILRSAGELGAILSSCLLDPPVHLPDIQLAWRADLPSALADVAQEVAAKLYAFSTRQ
jgi:DNA-binding transcriptional LysR family regulator